MWYYHIWENLETRERKKGIHPDPNSLTQALLAFGGLSYESLSYACFNRVVIISTYIFYLYFFTLCSYHMQFPDYIILINDHFSASIIFYQVSEPWFI